MLELNVWATTHIGNVKPDNEDAVTVFGFASQSDSGDILKASKSTNQPCLVAIADGVGGEAFGQRASRAVVEYLHTHRKRFFTGAAQDVLIDADLHLRSIMEAEPSTVGMATTVVGLFAHEDNVVLFNVGDSECFRWNGDFLSRITTTHAAISDDSDRKAGLTQVLGGRHDRSTRPLEPYAEYFSIADGDQLLLCSDGLTDCVDKRTIERILAARAHLGTVVADLVTEALRASGKDNISIIMVEVVDPALRASEERHRLEAAIRSTIVTPEPPAEPPRRGFKAWLKKQLKRTRDQPADTEEHDDRPRSEMQ